MATRFDEIPGVGRPARDALNQAGYPYLESLDGVDYKELLKLHGVGKRGLERLQAALVERGWRMVGAPKAEKREATWTEGHTGVNTEDYAGGLSLDPPICLMSGGSLEFELGHDERAGGSVPVSHRSLPH